MSDKLTYNDIELEGCECCAIREVSGISNYEKSTPKNALVHIAERFFSVRHYGINQRKEYKATGAFILFSEVVRYNNRRKRHNFAEDVKEYIEAHKLGSVNVSDELKNPNSKNIVKPYMWGVDKKALLKFYKKNRASYIEKDDDY